MAAKKKKRKAPKKRKAAKRKPAKKRKKKMAAGWGSPRKSNRLPDAVIAKRFAKLGRIVKARKIKVPDWTKFQSAR